MKRFPKRIRITGTLSRRYIITYCIHITIFKHIVLHKMSWLSNLRLSQTQRHNLLQMQGTYMKYDYVHCVKIVNATFTFDLTPIIQ